MKSSVVLPSKRCLKHQARPYCSRHLRHRNTIAGSLLHNYELLRQSGTTVVGEHKLHIEHSICCLPEDDWSTLQEVHSHPVALMQCGKFLANHPDLKAVEAEDTAGSAAYIAQHKVRDGQPSALLMRPTCTV